MAAVTEVANDWLVANFDNFDGSWKEYVTSLTASFARHSDHVSDCFTDTRDWAKGELFSQKELENEIIKIASSLYPAEEVNEKPKKKSVRMG